MTVLFQQLWYTWALRGMEGFSQYQVRATSKDLADPVGRAHQAARRLCRFDGPPSDSGRVSFGWVDLVDLRFVFRRTLTPTGSSGQPAAFGAHVLVGPRESCPPSLAARLWGADLWRDVDESESSLLLPAIDLREAAESASLAPAVPHEVLEALLATFLLARERRVRLPVAAPSELLVSAMAEIVEGGPSYLYEDASFSSYESGGMVSAFDVVGVDDPESAVVDLLSPDGALAALKDSQEAAVAKSLLAGRDRGTARLERSQRRTDLRRLPTEAAAEVARSDGGEFDVRVFVGLADALEQLATGGSTSVDRLLVALSHQRGAPAVLALDAGRTAVGAALAGGDERVEVALRRSMHAVDPADVQMLGDRAAQQLLVAGDWPSGVFARLVRVSWQLEAATVEAFFASLSARTDVIASLDGESRARLLRQASDRGTTTGRVLEELLAIPPDQLASVVRDLDVPPRWRARAIVRTPNKAEALRVASAQTVVEPAFAGQLADEGLPPESLLSVVRATGSPGLAMAAALAAVDAGIDQMWGARLLEEALRQGEGTWVVDCLSQMAAEGRHRHLLGIEPLAELTVRVAAEAIGTSMASALWVATVDRRALSLLRAVGTERASVWTQLIEVCTTGFGFTAGREQWNKSVEAAGRCISRLPADEKTFGAELALDAAAMSARGTSLDLNSAADLFARGGGPLDDASRCLRLAARASDTRVIEWGLIRAAELIGGNRIPELNDQRISQRVERSLLDLASIAVGRLLPYLGSSRWQGSSKGGRRWLEDVARAVD